MCYAISAGADPFGPYYRYMFLRPLFPDYPRPAIWPDGYYVPTSTGDDVIQKHACVVERAKMLKGEPAAEQCVVIDGVNFLNNADLDGKAASAVRRAEHNDGGGRHAAEECARRRRHLRLEVSRRLEESGEDERDWSGQDRRRAVPVPWRRAAHATACRSRERIGGSTRRATRSWRAWSTGGSATDESIVAVHSVNTTAGGGGVRWYEFRIDQQPQRDSCISKARTAPDNFFRWMASPAIDRFGNIGIGYSFGGTPHFAGQRFAGRLADDPPGVLGLAETVLVDGEGGADQHDALGGLHADGRRSRRRLHHLVCG